MKSRAHLRHPRHFQVRFREHGSDKVRAGYTVNISSAGMFIKTNFPSRPGSRVQVQVSDPINGFVVEGMVVHAAKVSPALETVRPSGMGIRFLPVEELIGNLMPSGARPQPTAAGSARSYAVRFADAGQFLRALDRDISEGGLFVPSGQPADLDAVVDIVLELPPPLDASFRAAARVVRRFEPQADGLPNLIAGMGVEFLEPRAVLDQLRAAAQRLATG